MTFDFRFEFFNMNYQFKCPICEMYFNTRGGAEMHTVEVHACSDPPIAFKVIETNHTEVSGSGWQQSENLIPENLIWDTPLLEEAVDNSILISENDPMLSTLPETNLISNTIGPTISYKYEKFEPTEGFQQNMESDDGENSGLASMIDSMLKVLPDSKYESISTKRNAPVCIVIFNCLFKIFLILQTDDIGTVHTEILDIKVSYNILFSKKATFVTFFVFQNLVCYSESNKTYHVQSGRGGHFSPKLKYLGLFTFLFFSLYNFDFTQMWSFNQMLNTS